MISPTNRAIVSGVYGVEVRAITIDHVEAMVENVQLEI